MLRLNVNKNLVKINLTVILLIYLTPSNLNKFFDGMPIIDKFDLFFLFIIFPIILLNLEFLKLNIAKYTIISLSIIKLILIFAPENGISHKIYFMDGKDQSFIKTYNSFWNKDYSAIQKYDWKKKENFPIDWLPSTDKILNSTNNYYYYTKEDFNNINLIFESQFLLAVYDESKLQLNLPIRNLVSFTIKDISLKKNLQLEFSSVDLQKGLYLVNLKHAQLGNNYEFSPSIISKKNNINLSLLAKNIAFLPNQKISQKNIFILNLLAKVFDFLVVIFIVIILLKLVFKFSKKILVIKNIIFIILQNYFMMKNMKKYLVCCITSCHVRNYYVY